MAAILCEERRNWKVPPLWWQNIIHPPDTLLKNSTCSLHLKKHGLAMFKLLERSCVPGFQE
jgi:hypothetical protein